MKLKKEVLLALIHRNGKFIIPNGNDHIENGDDVIVISRGMPFRDINDIYED